MIKMLLILSLVYCSSCTKKEKGNLKNRREYMTFMHRHVGKNECHEIFNFLQNSVRSWTANGLGYFSFLNVSKNYTIDSLMCFNEKKNKMVGAIPMQQLLPDGVQDDIWFLFGVKIDQDWYFLSGSTVVLPREYYQKDIHTPLSWEKLSELSMKHIFSGYLKRTKTVSGRSMIGFLIILSIKI